MEKSGRKPGENLGKNGENRCILWRNNREPIALYGRKPIPPYIYLDFMVPLFLAALEA